MNKLTNAIFKIFIELFIFDKVKRSKIKAKWAKMNLKKYLVFQQIEQLQGCQPALQENVPIWQYWHQGRENAPDLIKKCLNSVEKFEGERKINVLSFDTIKDYIELPERYYDLVNSGKMPVALFSDILRMYLLAEYGGIWIDSTILLTDKIPDDVINSSFCVVRKDRKKDNQGNMMSCYFIRANKDSANLNAIKRTLENYWTENDFPVNYFMFEHISTMLSNKTPELKAEWDKMPYIDGKICGKLQTLMEKSITLEEFSELKSKIFMHKLTYKKQPSKEFLKTVFNSCY